MKNLMDDGSIMLRGGEITLPFKHNPRRNLVVDHLTGEWLDTKQDKLLPCITVDFTAVEKYLDCTTENPATVPGLRNLVQEKHNTSSKIRVTTLENAVKDDKVVILNIPYGNFNFNLVEHMFPPSIRRQLGRLKYRMTIAVRFDSREYASSFIHKLMSKVILRNHGNGILSVSIPENLETFSLFTRFLIISNVLSYEVFDLLGNASTGKYTYVNTPDLGALPDLIDTYRLDEQLLQNAYSTEKYTIHDKLSEDTDARLWADIPANSHLNASPQDPILDEPYVNKQTKTGNNLRKSSSDRRSLIGSLNVINRARITPVNPSVTYTMFYKSTREEEQNTPEEIRDPFEIATEDSQPFRPDSDNRRHQRQFDHYGHLVPRSFNFTKKKITPKQILGYTPSKEQQRSGDYIQLLDSIRHKNYLSGTDSPTNLILEGKPYTFGVEIETIYGSFDDPSKVKHLNMQAVHDGSLRNLDDDGDPIGEPEGKEYVTGVLYGDEGFNHLHKIFKTLREECKVDKRCSFHVHIGSLKWNSADIAAGYLLGLMIEKDIFSMLPKSRRNNPYCSNLKDIYLTETVLKFNPNKAKTKEEYKKCIDFLYERVFQIVSNQKSSRNYNKRTVHPDGRHGGWNIRENHRYKWLNFTNIIFNQRGNPYYKTIEMRNHSGTLNFSKGKNWVMIVAAYCDYVHNNKKEIFRRFFKGEKFTVNEIIKASYSSKKAHKLNSYINLRKKLFAENPVETEKNDYDEKTNPKNKKEIICA